MSVRDVQFLEIRLTTHSGAADAESDLRTHMRERVDAVQKVLLQAIEADGQVTRVSARAVGKSARR
jgi:hypothetical protein